MRVGFTYTGRGGGGLLNSPAWRLLLVCLMELAINMAGMLMNDPQRPWHAQLVQTTEQCCFSHPPAYLPVRELLQRPMHMHKVATEHVQRAISILL